MILSWMLYSVAVAALLGGAAVAAETLLRWLGRPTRLAWALALVASAVLPLRVMLAGKEPATAASVGPAPSVGVEAGMMRVVTADPPLLSASAAWMDVLLLWIWGSETVLLLLWLGVSSARLHAARRTWKTTRVGGMGVLLSRVAGPAVMGWWRGTIVVPEWALSLGQGGVSCASSSRTRRSTSVPPIRRSCARASSWSPSSPGIPRFGGSFPACASPWRRTATPACFGGAETYAPMVLCCST